MATKDFYKILEIPRTATEDDIKKSYRRLAKKFHPDVNKGDKDAEERFKDISEAYEVLSDKKKREEYDMFGAEGVGAGFQRGYGQQYYRPGAGSQQGGFDFSSFFGGGRASTGAGPGGGTNFTEEDLNSIFGDIFGMGGAGPGKARGRGTKRAPLKGADRHYTMEVDFLDAVQGKTTKIAIPEGRKTTKINVKIPAGIDSGSKIRLVGKGEPSPNNGPSGDLYIEIQVRPHPYFSRKGNDIYLDVPISIEEAVNGAKIDVPTISGNLSMKIPPGTQGGQKLRLKGKGVPFRKGKGAGDQYVVIQIRVPKDVGAEGRRILEEFFEKNPMQPRKNLF